MEGRRWQAGYRLIEQKHKAHPCADRPWRLLCAISDGTNIKRSKPVPEVFLKAAQFIGLEPGQCLVAADARAGIEVAIAGGFDSADIGDAAECGRATYAMKGFADLTAICGV